MSKSCIDCYMWPYGVHTKTCSECHDLSNWKPNLPDNVTDINLGSKADDPLAKDDGGKLEIDLVPPQIARDIAEVRMFAVSGKYPDPEGWRRVHIRRYVNALMRHLLAFLEDNDSVDEESGIPHYKHAACNMAFICELKKEANNEIN